MTPQQELIELSRAYLAKVASEWKYKANPTFDNPTHIMEHLKRLRLWDEFKRWLDFGIGTVPALLETVLNADLFTQAAIAFLMEVINERGR